VVALTAMMMEYLQWSCDSAIFSHLLSMFTEEQKIATCCSRHLFFDLRYQWGHLAHQDIVAPFNAS
jgi:hypothetical protein